MELERTNPTDASTPLPVADVADALTVPVWRTDAEGTPVYFNQAWLDLRQTTLAEELRKGWLEAVHPDDLHRCLGEFQTALQTRQSFTISFRLRDATQEHHIVRLSARPVLAIDGGFRGFVGTLIEVIPERPNANLPPLSRRQQQVLRLVAAGMDNLQISAHLSIAERTVKAHVTALYRKLGCENRTQLALRLIGSALPPIPDEPDDEPLVSSEGEAAPPP